MGRKKKIKSNIPAELLLHFSESDEDKDRRYNMYKELLLTAFRDYRNMNEENPKKAWVENLVKNHAKICKSRPEKETSKRRHNALVYKCITKTVIQDSIIAQKLNVSEESLYRDIRLVIDDIMIIAFGMDGVNIKDQK